MTTCISTVEKAWKHPLEDGGSAVVFTLTDFPGKAFQGGDDWLPLLEEAISLRTVARVEYSEPEKVKCGDPFCGDGCCDDENCTNYPEGEPGPFLVRCDTIEWM